jgi:hypothetical protein
MVWKKRGGLKNPHELGSHFDHTYIVINKNFQFEKPLTWTEQMTVVVAIREIAEMDCQ